MRLLVFALLVLGLALGSPAGAVVCALDVAPARTLLLPHFAFDLSRLNKPQKTEATTVVINNTSDEEVIAHISVWTDLARPSVGWDVDLPPLGSLEIPIHEIFLGERTEFPGDPDPELVAPPGGRDKAEVRDFHTGRPVEGECHGYPHGDNVVRGYITIDANVEDSTIFRRSRRTRSEHANVLTGVVRYEHRKKKFAATEPLIHLEARNQTEGPGQIWAVDFDLEGMTTDLVVWRDPSGGDELDLEDVCDRAELNGWYPLGQDGAMTTDRDGNQAAVLGPEVNGFPLASGVYRLGPGGRQLPVKEGTLYLDLGDAPGFVSIRQIFGSLKRQGQASAVPLGGIICQSNAFRRSMRKPF